MHGCKERAYFHGYCKSYSYLPLYCFCGNVPLWAQLRDCKRDASEGNCIPGGAGNPVQGCDTCGSVGRFPGASVFAEGRLVRFGRRGLRYTKSKFPNGAEQSVVAADLNLNFKLGPTRNRLLIYTQLRERNSTSGVSIFASTIQAPCPRKSARSSGLKRASSFLKRIS